MTAPTIPATPTLLVAPVEVELLPTDTCDRCGPAVTANTAVRLITGGMLTFCNNHYNRYAVGLVPLIVGIRRNEVK